MPRRAKELTPVQVRRLKKPGLHSAGGVAGLQLQVTATGARSWILRAMIGDRRRDIGLGGFPDVPLQNARERAREARDLIRQGVDPVEARRKARAALIAQRASALTFDQAAEKFLASKLREFRNPKHQAQWRATLATYASPIIGKLPVADVALPHIVSILEPLWRGKTETGVRVRGRIEAVLNWATISGFRKGDNPARWRGHLDAVLPKPRKVSPVEHFRAIPIDDVPGFMAALREREGIAARALEFLALTAARSGEVRGATWSEIDLEARAWTIPGTRMKAGREHRVPLSERAAEILRAIPRFPDCPYVFPAARGGMLSTMTLIAVMRRMKLEAVPHGLRSSFRDWAAERTAYPAELAEAALAHVVGDKTEAAYRRGDLFDRRRAMMNAWATFCSAPRAKGDVVPLRRGKGA